MGIQELEINGFRSLRNVRWAPGKVNVLIGPNGSGKSNLLRALELIQSAATGNLSQSIVDQGGFAQALWNESEDQIYWNLKESIYNYEMLLKRLAWANDFVVDKEQLSSVDGVHLFRQPDKAEFRNDDGETIPVPMDRIAPNQTLLSLTNNIADLQTWIFRAQVGFWNLHQDLRVDRFSQIRQSAVARVESRISPDGQNLIPVLHTLYSGNREFKRSLDAAMLAAFGSEYEELIFPPASDQRVQLRLRWKSLHAAQSAANLSDGTLRFLLLIAILSNPAENGLIAIDEPEVGLHPNMLPVLAELAYEASMKSQVIFTTHSPQFLNAFRDEAPTTTVAEWVEGETRLSVLDGKDLQRWLERYTLGDLFASGQLEAMV